MVQSPSWEANWFAASQEIPRISRNPNVHYRTHKRPPPVPILGQPNPDHKPTSHLLEIHHNIIHPSTPRSPQWSSSLRFPHQDPIHTPLLTHTRHIPSPSHSSRFYHPHNIGWAVQIIYLLVMQSPPFPVTFSLLGPYILLNTIFSNTLTFVSSRNVNDQVSHPYKTTGKIKVKYTSLKGVLTAHRNRQDLWYLHFVHPFARNERLGRDFCNGVLLQSPANGIYQHYLWRNN